MYGPKEKEITAGWKLHNKVVYNLYSTCNLCNQIKENEINGHVAQMLNGQVDEVLVGKLEGTNPLGRLNSLCENGETRLKYILDK
jgi:hypothetical protein